VFVTGRSGAGFHAPGPALRRGRAGHFSGNARPAPARGPPGYIPWTGPRLLPHIFSGDPSGVWVGRGPERAQGQGMPKKTPRPRPLSGAGRGKGPGARIFRGPIRPVTNFSSDAPVWSSAALLGALTRFIRSTATAFPPPMFSRLSSSPASVSSRSSNVVSFGYFLSSQEG